MRSLVGRSASVVVAVLALCVGQAAVTLPARADFTMTQNVVLIQDRGPFATSYHNFAGYRIVRGQRRATWSWGEPRYRVIVYRLTERLKRWNYFIAVVNVANTNRHGPRRASWSSVTIKTRRAVNYSTHSSGHRRVEPQKCRRYPVNLSAGFHGFSAGTTVGHFSTCRDRPSIQRSSVRRGASWFLTQFGAINSATAHKYIRVRRGQRPAFRVTFTVPCDWNDHGTIVQDACSRSRTVRY
jgi:hypothetical protein